MQTEAKRDEVPLPEPVGIVVVGTQALRAFTADQLREYGRQCAQAERERCAQVCDEISRVAGDEKYSHSATVRYEGGPIFAAAIRSQNLIKE